MTEPGPRPYRDAIDRIAAAHESDAIQQALAAARERLGMDAAYVTTIDERSQIIGELAGDASALGFGTGTEVPIESTYCRRMLDGRLPSVVPDTSTEPAVAGLPATGRIGAYVGVPIVLADGTVHGTLCGVSSRPRPELGEAELGFMQALARIVAERIQRVRGDSVKAPHRLVDGRRDTRA